MSEIKYKFQVGDLVCAPREDVEELLRIDEQCEDLDEYWDEPGYELSDKNGNYFGYYTESWLEYSKVHNSPLMKALRE